MTESNAIQLRYGLRPLLLWVALIAFFFATTRTYGVIGAQAAYLIALAAYVGMGARDRDAKRVVLGACLIVALIAWALWDLQTDRFPFNESQARPSWYVYGWPLCYATSSRGRFNLVTFDASCLIVDAMLSVVMVACTLFAVKHLCRHIPRLRIANLLAITAAFVATSFLWLGGLQLALKWLMGADPSISPMAGNARDLGRLIPFEVIPISLGMASVGFSIVAIPFALLCHYSHQDEPK